MLDKELYRLKDIAYIFKGYSTTKLKGNIENAINNRDKSNSNFDDFLNKEEVKILGWKQIKEYVKNHKVDDNCNVIEISRKYNKNINYMQKGDIIFPIFSPKDKLDIVYVDEDPEERYIYNETVLIVRVTDTNIDSKYIYIMCKKAKSIQDIFLQIKPENKIANLRFTKEQLALIRIAKLTDKERKRIIKEYDKLQLAEENFSKEINQLQAQILDQT